MPPPLEGIPPLLYPSKEPSLYLSYFLFFNPPLTIESSHCDPWFLVVSRGKEAQIYTPLSRLKGQTVAECPTDLSDLLCENHFWFWYRGANVGFDRCWEGAAFESFPLLERLACEDQDQTIAIAGGQQYCLVFLLWICWTMISSLFQFL
jgi:hypothetical protein